MPPPPSCYILRVNLDLTTIQTALNKGTCKISALPASAQAFLGNKLLKETGKSQLWIADSFQTLEKLTDCFRTFSKHWKKNILVFQGLENQDMTVTGESLQALQILQSGSDEPFVLITLFQCLEKKVPRSLRVNESETVF